jgi:hypothetical protein
MENRETRIIETSGGHKVEIYTYANGREFNRIVHMKFKGATFKLSDDQKSALIENYQPGWNEAQEEEKIRSLVISFDGKTENLVEEICDGALPWNEYEEIIAALDELLGKKKPTEVTPQ